MTQKIKVLTNKKNPDVRLPVEHYTRITKDDFFGTRRDIVFTYSNKVKFIWSFDNREERDRIYEKIKPYFEFKEVEEVEID